MALSIALRKKVFHFRFDARTSRGAMKDRTSWFLVITDSSNGNEGIGECAPLQALSGELNDTFEQQIEKFVSDFNALGIAGPLGSTAEIQQLIQSRLKVYARVSSLVFAFESAMLDLFNGGSKFIFKNEFLSGKALPINGLIWMGGIDFMLQQIEIKIRDGFRCIKVKVGGIDFEKECDILQYIRRKYFREDITIRLDANGAFKPDDVLYKLKELSKFTVHSIEQPLKRGSEHLPGVCSQSPIPIALDEELFDVWGRADQASLLKRIMPRFIILKPTLHGGLANCESWISVAREMGIGWWITSALESNIGLNAIAQFTANYEISIPQGLGTGGLYEDNFASPLEISRSGSLIYNPRETWEVNFD